MDNENFNNYNDEELENIERLKPVDPPGVPESGDYGKTMEMDSLRINQPDETRGITPRNEFTELNSADDMSRTLLMDSVDDGSANDVEDYIPVNNPVKKRRRKKKQINHTRTMGQIFLGVVISVAAICIGSILSVHAIDGLRDITGMAKTLKEFDISITEDMTIDEIAETLEANGIILKSSFFKTYVKHDKSKGEILVGTHTLLSNMSYGNIVATLKRPKQYTKTVTIMFPEGSTASDVGKLLEENLVCRASDFEKIYKSKLNKYDFEEGIADNPNRFNALEGYIWPDTYEFYVIDDMEKYPTLDTSEYALNAASTMFNTFEKKITKAMKERMEDLDMSLDEIIILASIIQREGTNKDNMAIISSVFHNRMNDPENYPKLQSDTTYTYINQVIRPNINSENSEKMQLIIEAYDTYNCDGLPAGAICNPGLEAINAALYPANTDYLYFLASKDGVFYYANTLEKHEQNKKDAALE